MEKARTDNAISVIGGSDAKGNFSFSRLEAVWEKWEVTPENNMSAEQWMFLLSRDGNIARYFRYRLVKTKEDRVITHETLPITAEEAQKKWEELRAGWYKKMKNP